MDKINTPQETPYQTPAAISPAPTTAASKKRLKSVSPLRTGLVLGALYAVIVFLVMLIFIPLTLAGISLGGSNFGTPGTSELGLGIGMLIGGPIIYGILGFIGGVISAWIYNFIAKITGGLVFTLEDTP